jgi:phenylpropionate dioxygenase-like ring-hydroxylating dioxygenase large terminal subunit
MMGLIPPRAYVAPGHLEREYAELFQPCWLFAGLLLEFQDGKYQGVRLGDVEVLLQCDDGGRARAFLNVCSHRHTRLCELGIHSGKVRCPYHSWVYNREGVPVGIPSKQAFPEVVAEPERYRLREFECEAVGQFIFVRLARAADAPTLQQYLGAQYAFLERASQGMNGVLDEFREEVDANWKVVIENSLEGYHVSSVHTATFMQVDGMSRERAAPQFFFDDARHSHLEHAADPEWVTNFGRVERKIGHWPWRFEHYTHHLIFPNLTVTSFMGYSFHIQRFDPVSAEKTRVHSRTTGVQFEDATKMGSKMMERIYADGHEFTHKVFAEDGEICRKVQAGLRHAERYAVFGEGIEDRVAHFQRAYVAVIK